MSTLPHTAEPVKPSAVLIRQHLLKAEHLEGWVSRIQPGKNQYRVHLTEGSSRRNVTRRVIHSLRELWQDGRVRVGSTEDDVIVIHTRGWEETVPAALYTPPQPQGEHYLWDAVVAVLNQHQQVSELNIGIEGESVVVEQIIGERYPSWAFEALDAHDFTIQNKPYESMFHLRVVPNRIEWSDGDPELEACIEYLERWGVERDISQETITLSIENLRRTWDVLPVDKTWEEPVDEQAAAREKLRGQIVRAMRLNKLFFAGPETPKERPTSPTPAMWRASWPEGHPDGRGWPSEDELNGDHLIAISYDYGFDDTIRLHEGGSLDETEYLWARMHEDDEDEGPSSPLGEGIMHAVQVLVYRAQERHARVLDAMPWFVLNKEKLTYTSRLGQWLSVIEALSIHEAELSCHREFMSQFMAEDVAATVKRYRAEVARIGQRIEMINQALARKVAQKD